MRNCHGCGVKDIDRLTVEGELDVLSSSSGESSSSSGRVGMAGMSGGRERV